MVSTDLIKGIEFPVFMDVSFVASLFSDESNMTNWDRITVMMFFSINISSYFLMVF